MRPALRQHIVGFVDALRQESLRVSVAESLDAVRAVAAVGLGRPELYEALAAMLIKDESDRPVYDRVFRRFFAIPKRGSRPRGDRRTGADPFGRGKSEQPQQPRQRNPLEKESQETRPRERNHSEATGSPKLRGPDSLRQRAILEHTPFTRMTTFQVEACAQLAEELARRFRARRRRRTRRLQRGIIDLRRTLRRAAAQGGIALPPTYRRPRPARPELLVLCDFSHSIAHASEFLLSLIQPLEAHFRRVRRFAFVDTPVEVSLEHGRFVPHGRLDLFARSDFGGVLVRLETVARASLGRNTILLVLGDARNNRRPHRAERLLSLRRRLRRIVWLNPESPSSWNTGDSVMNAYMPACDHVLAAETPTELRTALRRAF